MTKNDMTIDQEIDETTGLDNDNDGADAGGAGDGGGKKKSKGGRPRGQYKPRSLDVDGDDVEISRLLAQCGSGWRCKITRVAPSWCDGTLQTIDVDPSSPIDIEDIRETWGGRKLVLTLIDGQGRFRKRINLKFPEPPMSHGRPLTPPGAEPIAPPVVAAPIAPPVVAPDAGYQKIMELLIKNQEAQKQEYTRSLESRLGDLERQLTAVRSAPPQYMPSAPIGPTAPPQPPLELLGQVSSIIKQVDDLRAVLGSGPVSADGDPIGGGVLQDAIRQLLSTQINKYAGGQQAGAAQTPSAPNLPAPPMPERDRPASGSTVGSVASADPATAIADLVKDKLRTMAPDRLEAILGIVLDDDAEITTEEEDDREVGEPSAVVPLKPAQS